MPLRDSAATPGASKATPEAPGTMPHVPNAMPDAPNAASELQMFRARRTAERALRAVAVLALLAALIRASGWWRTESASAIGSSPVTSPLIALAASSPGGSTAIESALRRAVVSPTAIRGVHVVANGPLNDTARSLLSAARSAEVPLTWTDSTHRMALAIEATALVDPRGGIVVRVAAPAGTRLAVRDTLGVVDSVRVQASGGSLRLGRAAGELVVRARGLEARSTTPISPVVRRVLLLARPGWEAKFTLAALEECGWQVDVRFAIAPRVAVTQGTPAPPDTAQYAAVVALDSSAGAMAPALMRYVRQGGGVILVGEATTLAAMQPLLAGRSATRQPGIPGGLITASPRVGLAHWPIMTRDDAIVLERAAQGTVAAPVLAARRIGAGRVVQVGYDGLWEWRMQGGEGSVSAHRAWWGRLVSSVAFAPHAVPLDTLATATTFPGDVAPYADLVARVGRPVVMPATFSSGHGTNVVEPWLFVIAAIALLLEWGSRRLRGAR